VVHIRLAAFDLVTRELAGADRIKALDALCGLTVGDRLHLEGMELAELGDLFEGECCIVHQPYGCRLRHEQLLSHGYRSSVRRAGVAGRGGSTTISGNSCAL